jgi:hypothetical protein
LRRRREDDFGICVHRYVIDGGNHKKRRPLSDAPKQSAIGPGKIRANPYREDDTAELGEWIAAPNGGAFIRGPMQFLFTELHSQYQAAVLSREWIQAFKKGSPCGDVQRIQDIDVLFVFLNDTICRDDPIVLVVGHK